MAINLAAMVSPRAFSFSVNEEIGVPEPLEVVSSAPSIANLITRHGAGSVAQAVVNNYLADPLKQLNAELDYAIFPRSIKDEVKETLNPSLSDRMTESSPDLQKVVRSLAQNQHVREGGAKEVDKISANAQAEDVGEAPEGKASQSQYWILVFAGRAAKIQSRYLDRAMANLKEMRSSQNDLSSGTFMMNQVKFQLNMRLFGLAVRLNQSMRY